MSDKIKQFVCLAGLPRTGSTLLSSILCQNPEIHAEGNSAVCQIMFDMYNSCVFNSNEQLTACNRSETPRDFLSQIPDIYYKNCKGQIIVDKCRAWTCKKNISILKNYMCEDYKIIVLERPITEIVKSFARLYVENNIEKDLDVLFTPNSEPIMRSINDINNLKFEINNNTENYKNYENHENHFLFISYDELVNNTEVTIQKIYRFCGWEPFKHDFQNVVTKYPENDSVYFLKGLHDIRPNVEKKNNQTQIPENILEKCKMIDKIMGYLPVTK